MNNYFIVPGLGNSGPEHWQTFFESTGDNFQRIEQQEWDAPECNDWIAAIDKAIAISTLFSMKTPDFNETGHNHPGEKDGISQDG